MLLLQMGNTPLHVALQSGHYRSNKVVETLLKGGADVNITNKVSNYRIAQNFGGRKLWRS